jgi:hypothetical protein
MIFALLVQDALVYEISSIELFVTIEGGEIDRAALVRW